MPRFHSRPTKTQRASNDPPNCLSATSSISGLQKGPAERGNVKKRQKSPKSVKKFFDNFSRRAKNVKNRQKASKSVKKFFDNFCAAPFFRKIRAPIKIKSALPPPPQKKGNFTDMVFPAERTHFFQVSIKLAHPFPAPELRTRILRTRGFC